MEGRDRCRSRFAGRVAGFVLLLAGIWAPPLLAQPCGEPPLSCFAAAQSAGSHSPAGAHLLVFGMNAALGGLTAGLRQHARGAAFWPAFVRGSAGGAAVYGGKALSAERFRGTGIVGRQIAAVGASVIRNVSEDRAPLDRLMLPAGPVRVYVDHAAEREIAWKLDLLGSGVLAYLGFSGHARFDSGASLSAGTPVFNTTQARGPGWHGNNTAGIILLREHEPHMQARAPDRELVFAHERIHLLQYDQALHTLSGPVEERLLRRFPGGPWIARHFDLGLVVLPIVLLNSVIPYDQRPWEREAHFFSGTHEH